MHALDLTAPAPPGVFKKVYRCGAMSPLDQKEQSLVAEQMRLASRYFNDLCAIERAARDAIRDVELDAGLRPARDALLGARRREAEAAAAWAAAGRPASGPAREDVDVARASLKAARQAFKAARQEVARRPEVAAATAEIRAKQASLKIDAREVSGVFWGTYLVVEPSHEQSLKRRGEDGKSRTIPLWDDGEPDGPRFRRFDGDGTVSMQLQKGMTVEELFGGRDRRVRVERLPLRTEPSRRGPPPDPNSNRSRRRGGHAYRLWLRVGSEGREPVWARFGLVVPRPFPADANFKWVHVHRSTVGHSTEWEAHFVVETRELPADPPCDRPAAGEVYVEFGWRVVPEGLRVATWLAPSGETGHLVLDRRTVEGIEKSAGIRAVRDRNANEALGGLLSLLRRDPASLPPWLPEEARRTSLHAWRSPERLQRLVRRVSAELGLRATRADYDAWSRPAGPDAWTARDLEIWRHQEWHLYDYERNQDLGARRNRTDIYRRFAADLARRYGTLVYEDFDLSQVAETPKTKARKAGTEPEPDSAMARTARANRFVAAVGELRSACVQAFASRRREHYEVEVDLGTQRCNACGCRDRWDAAPRIEHTCSGCGVTFDQDVNHVRNMRDEFARSRVRLVEEGRAKAAKAAAAAGKGRWARAKAAKAAKAAAPEGGA